MQLARSTRDKILHAIAVFAIALAAVLAAHSAQASVWSIQQDWTVEKEDQFGAWLATMTSQSPNEQGMQRSPLFSVGQPLHGIPVDCADFVYASRIIFAAQNGLPFASKTSYKRKSLDASKAHWDSIPKEARLRAFIKDVIAATGTWSLPRDTVPVTEISREHVKPGTILLAAQSVGHAWMIRRVRETGIPELVFASVPALEELFYRDGLPRGEAVFDKLPGGTREAGLRSFCLPEKSCPRSATAPSLEWRRHQEWRPLVLRALQIRPEPLIDSIGREIKNVCRETKARATLAQDAFKLRTMKNRCLKGLDFYNYSTMNRDARLKEGFLDLWELWMTTTDIMDDTRITGRSLSKPLAETLDQISQVFTDSIIDQGVEEIVCPVSIDHETKLSMRDVRQHSIAHRLSADPNESVRARWGIEPEKGECR
jgi:hypothetical protein